MDKLDLKNCCIHLSATDPIELKEWKVGKKYTLEMLTKMSSMSISKDGGHATLDILKVIPQEKESYDDEVIKTAMKGKK